MKRKSIIAHILYNYGIFFVLLLLVIFFAVLTNGISVQVDNIFNLMINMVPIALITMGVTFVIITTGIDLSSGSVLALSAVSTAVFAQNAGAATAFIPWAQDFPVIVPIFVGLAVGVASGFLNGLIITKTHIPPFIATLGMMTAVRGMAFLPTKGEPIGQLDDALVYIGKGSILGIPVPILVMAFMIGVSHILLTRTRLGRYAFAIGGNIIAAKTSGINTDKYLILIYTYAGFLSGLAGIVITGIVASGQPLSGMLYELDAIASAVIGGVSLYGGVGSIPGAIVGVFIIGVIKNGLDLMFISAYWQQIIRGFIIVVAVIIDVQKRKLRRSMK